VVRTSRPLGRGRGRLPVVSGSIHRYALLALVAAGGLKAQGFTSPRGFGSVEGDARHFALFHPGYERFMQIDASQTGIPAAALRSIAFRRDGDVAASLATPRSVDLTVRMGTADLANATGDFTADWSAPPTTVFTTKTIQTPDWSRLAAARPAPFDLVIPFDVAWSYDGSAPLAFELQMENTTGFLGPEVDADFGAPNPFTQAVGQAFDFGCLVRGQFLEMSHTLDIENYGPSHTPFGIRVGFSVALAPRQQAAVVNIDFSDPALTVPGLCAPLHALPNISLPLGVTDALGTVPRTWFELPYSLQLEGIHLFTQALVLDPGVFGIPAAVSERRDAVVPDAPHSAPPSAYTYATSAQAARGTLWRDRAVIVHFGQ
jgi:hypothetical protein